MERLTRDSIFHYVKEKYQTEPEYLWAKFPDYAVLRKRSKNKWYGIIMNIQKEKLSFADDKTWITVLNLKCPPELIGSFIDNKVYFPAYHMNKEHWLSILLEAVSFSDSRNVFNLIDLSYKLI
ncbi:MAG TPA: MmcQ/YjbR family DNA-binding protein [Candidatus Megamonas gallistercoris]|nr:MmcQ/YjbR family DNA-binding protein [Candidatus Megamonas gallistercoris]